ncbi:acetyltransferase [Neisseria animaloris]|uniref:ribosomal protein S18-alanine N-acetyltransferase n=1 Tax=Neisseria animaloris TaxID=326522 RepID=UPI000A18EB41|nr:ribosomal protein S18-alanine N-acetyltransferase [Neisseria animaloris]OSI07625.1 ribosomal-protein-alanine N-acetyltransferase [Neisseria animaloris]VEH88251.1 acetyltransferase [Neisseria animaloris]
MLIRPATSQDCFHLAELDAQCNPSPWSANQFQTALNNRFNTVLVIEQDKKLSAFAVWQTICGESELHLIATAPEYRRIGLASHLLSIWFQSVLEHKVERLFLEARESNIAAQSLYRKLGFSEYGRRKLYYTLSENMREDAVLMEKLC